VVGYVKTVGGGVGYDVRLRNIAGKIGEDIVDLRCFFGRISAEAVECAAERSSRIDNGLAVDLVSGECLDLGSAGMSVHIACNNAGKLALGKVSDNVERAELSCLRALVVEVCIEEDEYLIGILVLKSSGSINTGAAALVSRVARAGNKGSSREPTGLECDQLKIIALECDAGRLAAIIRAASASDYGVAEGRKLIAEPFLHDGSRLLETDEVGSVFLDSVKNSALAVVENVVAVNLGNNAEIKGANFKCGAHF